MPGIRTKNIHWQKQECLNNYIRKFAQSVNSMTNFIPIFPLAIVVYPGEEINLHIFEPRYKQLIKECITSKKPFGIVAVTEHTMNELGTLVEITELSKTYDNGEMDIKTKGQKIFRILEVIKEIPDKMYSGAIVNYPKNVERGHRLVMQKIIKSIKALHTLLKADKQFKKSDDDLWSYDVAHHAGLTLQEEYDILGLMNELQRQEYLKRHLAKVLPVVEEMEMLKEKIKLNGHFKNLEGLNL